ncbi:MAG: hypothetical protein ABI823_06730 [Bryobacteraceae bacterium]
MSDYLAAYGQGDERREKLIKRVVLAVLIVAIVGTTGYFYFRTWSEERSVNAFLDKLKAKDYKAAYAAWGCTEANPCKGYAFDKFLEDWGDKAPHGDAVSAKVDDSEPCGNWVLVTVKFAKGEPAALSVAKSNGEIGFAPDPECMGKKWRFKAFFRRVFGG